VVGTPSLRAVNIFKGQIVICPYRRDSHHVHFKYNIFPVSCVGANDYSPFFFGDLSTRNDGTQITFYNHKKKESAFCTFFFINHVLKI